jgi:S1-C subfamily serine protease
MNRSNLLSGALGGLVVLVLGAVLIATNVIDTGTTTREVVQPISQPAATRAASGQRTVADIYRQEGRGVVFIQARGVSSGDSPFGLPSQQGVATGSGFVVNKDGTILTNAHVVDGASSVTVSFSDGGGDAIKADVKGRDVSSDLAVLKIDPSKAKNLTVLPLGNSSKAQVGDPVVAIGNPFGFTRTVTTGIVSALQRQISAPNGFQISHVLQTDAAINPGNSGGPLLDSQGRVIGINSQIATGGSGSGSVGIGFAIPIDTAKSLLPQLEKGGQIQRAWLGIKMSQVTKQIAGAANLPVDSGALLESVQRGGPAAKAGLRGGHTETTEGLTLGGDVIVKVDGKDVHTTDDVATAVNKHKPGDKIQVEFYRRDSKKTVSVTLGKRPNNLQDDSTQQGGGGGVLPLP